VQRAGEVADQLVDGAAVEQVEPGHPDGRVSGRNPDRNWSDCRGDLETRWDKDTLLTVATLYWVTATIGSSFSQYYNYQPNEPVPQITVPAAVTLSNEPA
jgi:hypothetical protein